MRPRILISSVVLSLAVHAGVGAYLWSRGVRSSERPRFASEPATTVVEVTWEPTTPPAEPDALVVALLDATELDAIRARPDPPSPNPPETAPARPTAPPSPPLAGTSDTPGTPDLSPGPQRHTPAGHALGMRSSRDVRVEVNRQGEGSPRSMLPGDVAAALEPDLGPPPPRSPLEPPRPRRPPRVRSELVPDGNGAFRADDLVFRARISEDGRVAIEDKPNLQVRLALPGRTALGRGLERWARDPYAHAKGQTQAAETGTVPILGGGFDLTDWAMRRAGSDPYSARKLAFLERTREERAALAKNAEQTRLRDAVGDLQAYLAELWTYEPWPAEQRRELLFQLWDECAEEGSADVLAAAAQVRATIEAFIRRHLPAGSAGAYAAEELERLNRRRSSRRRFDPYRD